MEGKRKKLSINESGPGKEGRRRRVRAEGEGER